MSVRCITWAWSVQTVDSSASKLVLLALADHANDENFECWPSLNHLANKCSVDRTTVARCLKRLELAGLIERKTGTANRSTHYLLKIPNICTSGATPLVAPRHQGSGATPLGVVAPRHSNHQIEPSLNRHSPLPPKGGKRDRDRKRDPAALQSFCVARCEICDPPHEWEVNDEYFDTSVRVMACPNWRKNLRN